jgi:ATP-dependent RNA helicase SUPV3L1/SUV3
MNISFLAAKSFSRDRAQGVTVLVGPTNTGKTHYALERMLCYSSGMIGLPLRLLAREVYNRAVENAGVGAVALITGEEKIKPKAPRYWISTVEAMPRNLDLPFVAVDEIQLAADLDRGHVFTDRLLNCRGREETLLIGAPTMTKLAKDLLPGANIRTRPRLSKLSFAGDTKMSRLRRRSAIVAFSVEDVYAIAEWIRRQNGGAAVVLGALSPRTRNAQVDMFQNGDVDYIVATDAIGMGLNLDVDHIVFAADRKFDGWQHRRLTPAEFGQIAGRAGRHHRDGTFGTTGRCPPFDAALVGALEDHRFDDVTKLQWRNAQLDLSSIPDLAVSLDTLPKELGLTRAPLAVDQMVLDIAGRDETVARTAKSRAEVARLWECCQIPDYRKLSPAAHSELALSVFHFVAHGGHIPDDWFARHVAAQDRTDGGLDILSARIAEVRTWTFIANRPGWLRDPCHWQSITRQVEDRLSDALHERLTQRFVDRRTSVLMRRLRENAMLEAEVTPSGDVLVEGQHVGQLTGFRFSADPQAAGEAARTLNAAAQKALSSEIEGRARRLSEAVDDAFLLANDGVIRWLGETVGTICAGAHVLQPRVSILADEQLTGQALAMVQQRLDLWLGQHVTKLLGPLYDLEKGDGLGGIARGIGFQIAESLGVLDRARVADDVKALTQDDRAALRKLGVRFGAYHLYLPNLIKPGPRALAAHLHALKHCTEGIQGLEDVLHLAASGRTSFAANKEIPRSLYRAAGFRICGDRAVRVDILERLADLIRPAISYRPGVTPGAPPQGAADGDGFVVTVAMTSLAGCSGESFASILHALGYQSERRKGPAITRAAPARSEDLVPSSGALAVTTGSAIDTLPQRDESPERIAPVADNRLPVEAAKAAGHNPGKAQGMIDSDDISGGCGNLPETAAEAVRLDQAKEEGAHEPNNVESENSLEGTAEDGHLVEIWRPHRQYHQLRKSFVRMSERHLGRRKETPAQALNLSPAKASGPQPAGPRKIATVVPPEGGGMLGEPIADSQSSLAQLPLHDLRKENGAHAADEQRAHRGVRHKGRMQVGSGNRNKADERGERLGERLDTRDNKTRSSERPPDPNSPFAKLLLLKARLEEKNNPEI